MVDILVNGKRFNDLEHVAVLCRSSTTKSGLKIENGYIHSTIVDANNPMTIVLDTGQPSGDFLVECHQVVDVVCVYDLKNYTYPDSPSMYNWMCLLNQFIVDYTKEMEDGCE